MKNAVGKLAKLSKQLLRKGNMFLSYGILWYTIPQAVNSSR